MTDQKIDVYECRHLSEPGARPALGIVARSLPGVRADMHDQITVCAICAGEFVRQLQNMELYLKRSSN